MKKIIMLLSLILFLIVLTTGYDQKAEEQSNSQKLQKGTESVTLTISAASSLKDVLEEIKTAYEEEKSNIAITYNFGSSGSLQQQIEQGANVDIFISASVKQMDALKSKELVIEDTLRQFLENEVVLITPKDSSVISDFKDLSDGKVKKVGLGEPKSVPAGQYGEEVLKALDIFSTVKSKAVYGKDVKEVLTWVETGNADAGIVYETDARVSDKVKIAAKAPKGSHKPVLYPAAVIKSSKNADMAKNFINFLYSSKAKPTFEKYGFKFLIN